MAKKKAGDGDNTGGRGRPPKTRDVSRERLAKRFEKLDFKRRHRNALLSAVSELFCRGYTVGDIREQLCEDQNLRDTLPDSYEVVLDRENVWDLLRQAAENRLFVHLPREDHELTRMLVDDYRWLADHVVVAQTSMTGALAQRAATKLLHLIRNVCQQKKCDTVHVGFAGGMTLRTVAERLALLLQEPHKDDPKTLVFHAMVASFDDDDFYADPNSFITFFIRLEPRVKVRLVRLPLPGIVETSRYDELKQFAGIGRVFERRKEIQIIVTSGSLWRDEHSTLRTYMKAAISEAQRTSSSENANGALTDAAFKAFDDQHVVGDLLWQPINEHGSVPSKSPYQVTTLMELEELPGFIASGGSVLLVMGCSGISRLPKSELLRTILDLYPKHCWVTDVVTDSPTVEGMYRLGVPGQLQQSSRSRKPK